MRILRITLPLLLLALSYSAAGAEEAKPDMVVERMSVKLVRGVTNVATCVAEIPKQTYLTIKEGGDFAYVVGPIKGIGMTLYRGLLGGAEALTFLVPQPGYYDPMLSPDYVWKEWEPKQERTGTGGITR